VQTVALATDRRRWLAGLYHRRQGWVFRSTRTPPDGKSAFTAGPRTSTPTVGKHSLPQLVGSWTPLPKLTYTLSLKLV